MLRKTIWIFVSRVITTLVAIPISILIARMLGPEGRGIYSLSIYIPSVLALIGYLGLNIANIYFVGKDRRYLSSAISNSIWFTGLLSIVFILAYLPLAETIHRAFLKESPYYYELIAVLALPLILLSSFLNSIMIGLNKIELVSKLSLGFSSISLILSIVAAYTYKSILGFILVWFIALFLNALANLVFLYKETKFGLGFDFNFFKESLKYGLKGHIGNIVQFFNYRLDVFLVSFFAGVGQAGIYTVSVSLAESLWFLSNSSATTLFPRIAGLGETESLKITPLVSRLSLAVTLLAGVLLFLLAAPLVNILFGNSFTSSYLPLVLLIPGIIVFSLTNVLSSDLAGRGKPQFGTYIALISLILTVVFDLIFIPKWGASGAGAASSISYAASTLFTLIVFSKLTGVRWVDLVFIKRQDLSLIKQFILKVAKR